MITVGMNYRVRAGKEPLFEEKCAAVVDAMKAVAGHLETHVYRDIVDGTAYLIVSEWDSKPSFAAFIRSDAFREVTNWGKLEVLAGRPSHHLYDRTESF